MRRVGGNRDDETPGGCRLWILVHAARASSAASCRTTRGEGAALGPVGLRSMTGYSLTRPAISRTWPRTCCTANRGKNVASGPTMPPAERIGRRRAPRPRPSTAAIVAARIVSNSASRSADDRSARWPPAGHCTHRCRRAFPGGQSAVSWGAGRSGPPDRAMSIDVGNSTRSRRRGRGSGRSSHSRGGPLPAARPAARARWSAPRRGSPGARPAIPASMGPGWRSCASSFSIRVCGLLAAPEGKDGTSC